MQYGIGLEYLPLKKFGFRIYAERNQLFSDEIDTKVYGSHNDAYWAFGIGINYFLNK